MIEVNSYNQRNIALKSSLLEDYNYLFMRFDYSNEYIVEN